MLVSFTLSNYRSFCVEQTLSMVATERTSEHESHLSRLPGMAHKLLPVAALYGANGAGKSNLVRGLAELQKLVLADVGPSDRLPRSPFSWKQEMREKPTEFVVRLLLQDELLEYGCSFGEHEVFDEWLSLYKGESRHDVFVRTSEEGQSAEIQKGPAYEEGLSKLDSALKVSVKKHQLFLAVVRATLDSSDQGHRISNVIGWFENGLTIIPPDARYADLVATLRADKEFRQFLGQFLDAASTGVTEINVEKVPLPSKQWGRLFEEQPGRDVLPLSDGSSELEREADGAIFMSTILTKHRVADEAHGLLPFGEESDGTKRLAHLAPALFQLRECPTTYVIDELDRSLHPVMSKQFLQAFLHECSGGRGQLIVTTHETHILDLDTLRRDEIWFVEKDGDGASKLYPLTDFKERKDLSVGKNYLRGRFGAIPFVGGVSRLFSDQVGRDCER